MTHRFTKYVNMIHTFKFQLRVDNDNKFICGVLKDQNS